MANDHPNVERVRTGFEAFARGDLSGLDELLDDDVVWHQPGKNAIAGTYRGKAELLSLFVRIWQETEGSVETRILDVFADDEFAVVLIHAKAERGDLRQDNHVVHVLKLTPEGKLKERWALADDQADIDRFWA
jgi:ketosteroid isomerase-like protein